MITCKLMLCAESVLVDRTTNNLSILNIIEEFSPRSLPALVPRLTTVNVFERDPNDPPKNHCTISLKLQNEIFHKQEIDFDFVDKIRHRNIFIIEGLVLAKTGIFEVICQYDTDQIISYNIKFNPPAPSIISQTELPTGST